MPYFLFTHDQHLKPHDNLLVIVKDRPPAQNIFQTKISTSTLSTVWAHSHRDMHGNVTLMMDSIIKNVMNFNYTCKFDHETLDYGSNDWANRS